MDAKEWAKCAIQLSGLYDQFRLAKWRQATRTGQLISEWNRARSAIFIHVPKNAGMSIYKSFGMDVGPYGTHIPATVYQRAEPEAFARSFKFAVIRNPWDRLVSAYHFLLRSPFPVDQLWSTRHLAKTPDFPIFMRALEKPVFRARILTGLHFQPQSFFLCDDRGALAVDHLIDFADLAAGVADVGRRLSVPVELPEINRSSHDDFRDYYDGRSSRVVEAIYGRDIALFERGAA
jgi:hypothetical protein